MLPFELKCGQPIGGSCGAVILDETFVALLRKKMGKDADVVLSPRRTLSALKEFRSYMKSHFNPYEPPAHETEFLFPLPGAPDILQCNLEAGYLSLSAYV